MHFKKFFIATALSLSMLKPFAQVNLQTGSATFSLPVFNWNDDKSRLNALVALSYNSGNGLKVGEISSSVGQGWNLIAGGVITRLQVGEPDDQIAYGTDVDWNIKKYPNGYLYANASPVNGCPIALTKYPLYKGKNQLYSQLNAIAEDKQLDYFSFQFNGKAGMFVLDGSTNQGITLGDSKMKISFQHDYSMANGTTSGIRTTITSFTIKDVDGLIYKFTRHGTTKLMRSYYCDQTFTYQRTQPTFTDHGVYYMSDFDYNDIINPNIITSWFLTEIEDALTHRTISFTYQNRSIDAWAGDELNFTHDQDDKEHQKYYGIVTRKFSKSETPAIDSISFIDGHSVVFNYGNFREDLNGDRVLSSVDIKYKGRFLSKYKLNTTYFIRKRYGNPVDNEKKDARLCLRSVQKIGVYLQEDTPPYIFDYYLGSDNSPDDFVPPQFFWAKDIWGFYNGSNSIAYSGASIQLDKRITDLDYGEVQGLCFFTSSSFTNLNPKSSLAKNGILRQIIYPTGGTLTYEYEENMGVLAGVTRTVGGVHVSKTSSTDGGFSNGCANPVTTSYHFILESGSPSLWGLEMPVNSISNSSYYEPKDRKYHYPIRNFSLFGSCYFKYQYPGILSQQQAISLTDWQRFMSTTGSTILGIVSAVMTIMDIATVIGGSTGVLAWASVIVDVIGGIIVGAVTCFHDYSQENTATLYYNSDLNGISPLPTQFKRVEITESPGSIGKTVQEFTSNDDYAIWEMDNLNFSSKQRFAPWAYGLPKLTTVYDINGKKVKETENVYNFNTVYAAKCSVSDRYDRSLLLKKPINKPSVKCLVKRTISQKAPDWNNNGNNIQYEQSSTSDLGVEQYDLYTGRTELETTYDRVYKNGDDTKYVQSITSYGYNDDNYQVKYIRTQTSEGKETQKNIFYTIDYVITHGSCNVVMPQTTTNPEIIALVQNNIIALPVETNELVNNVSQYTYDKATLFTTLDNGDIKPWKALEGRFTQPAWRSSPWPNEYSGFSFWTAAPLLDPASPDYSFYKVSQTFSYTSTGELVAVADEGGRTISSIYGYNNKYVTASAINAKPNEIYFADFEQNGWDVPIASPLSAYDNIVVHTGKYSGRIDNSGPGEKVVHADKWLSISLSEPTKFKYSGWIYSTGPSAEIFLFMKTATEQNYFTYVSSVLTTETNKWVYVEGEYTVPVNITKLNLRIDNNSAGSVWFDDLRLYPSKSRMETFTFDPLIGKTSESDVNNRVTYYDYDRLGRLQFIKDDKKNIVKMYEYNNVSEQNGCPGTYYNRLITVTFTKNNCGSGYVGSNVIFTVPANAYSSTISQADADAKAENNILENGQNYANANGSCIPIYYNTAQSQTFETEGCDEGFVGATITYSVPAGRYSSLISQTDANQKALDEITANGQAYANDPANRACNFDSNPHWEWSPGDLTRCQTVNGQLPPHLFLLATDVNPNSPSYGQQAWKDAGPSDDCPSGNYYNDDQSGDYYSNNCGSGQMPVPLYISVPPGSYSSTISLQDANDKARQAAQNYADTYGSCETIMVHLEYSYWTGGDYVAIELYNSNDYSEYYYFEAAPHSNDYLGYVPEGTYDITFIPYNDTYYKDYSICNDSLYDKYGQCTLYSVFINSDCSLIGIGGETWP